GWETIRERGKSFARSAPVFREERNFGEVKTRFPEIRIKVPRFLQRFFRRSEFTHSHQGDATKILGGGDIGLALVEFVEQSQSFRIITRVKLVCCSRIHCLDLRLGWSHHLRRKHLA